MDETSLQIRPALGPIVGRLTPPGSKSLTNRALVCAALADGVSELSQALDSEDTRIMVQAWRSVGVDVQASPDFRSLTVAGCGGKLPAAGGDPDSVPQTLMMGNSGTSIRFLTAALAACGGHYLLDGVPRMRQRPIGDLGQALRNLGAEVHCHQQAFPPVRIQSQGLRGGRTAIDGTLSSQFLSGLLMAAPLAGQPVELTVAGDLVSQPYVTMTCQVMEAFGVKVQRQDRTFCIRPQNYRAGRYQIEPDASAASYFWAAAAITGGDVTVQGLSADSLQGDVRFVHVLQQMGCQIEFQAAAIRVRGRAQRGIDIDMNEISDTVQTLAAVALFAQGTTRIRGVAHNRHKETDRIEDLATELRRLGAEVQTYPDGLAITPRTLQPTLVRTYNDHRMAMSLALVGLVQPGIQIQNPACTAKTYPNYFVDLTALIDGSPRPVENPE